MVISTLIIKSVVLVNCSRALFLKNFHTLLIVLSKETNINEADSDGLIDAFCHNDLSFQRKE